MLLKVSSKGMGLASARGLFYSISLDVQFGEHLPTYTVTVYDNSGIDYQAFDDFRTACEYFDEKCEEYDNRDDMIDTEGG